eukprot:SM000202S05875  [mRNA]  locus=s202:39817:45927:- [translate_table: standard]
MLVASAVDTVPLQPGRSPKDPLLRYRCCQQPGEQGTGKMLLAAAPTGVGTAAEHGGGSRMIQDGDLVIIYERHDRMKSVRVAKGEQLQNRYGVFNHHDWIGIPYGSKVFAVRGAGFVYLLAPTPELWTLVLPHRTQILYAADIALVVTGLELRPGSLVLESGTGSGSLTTSLARAVAPSGAVHTFDFHEARATAARDEFEQNGLANVVTVGQRDIQGSGFPAHFKGCADAAFLDLPGPWLVVPSVAACLRPDGRFCAFSPCIEQVQRTCEALAATNAFRDVRTFEVLLRTYEVRKEELLVDLSCRETPGSDKPCVKRRQGEGRAFGQGSAATLRGEPEQDVGGLGKADAVAGDDSIAGEGAHLTRDGRGDEMNEGYGTAADGPKLDGELGGASRGPAGVTMILARPHAESKGHTGYLTFARRAIVRFEAFAPVSCPLGGGVGIVDMTGHGLRDGSVRSRGLVRAAVRRQRAPLWRGDGGLGPGRACCHSHHAPRRRDAKANQPLAVELLEFGRQTATAALATWARTWTSAIQQRNLQQRRRRSNHPKLHPLERASRLSMKICQTVIEAGLSQMQRGPPGLLLASASLNALAPKPTSSLSMPEEATLMRTMSSSASVAAAPLRVPVKDATSALTTVVPELPAKQKPVWLKEPSENALALAKEIAEHATPGWSGFIRPVDKIWEISSVFGPRWGRHHNGVDLAAPTGEPVLAADAGKVTYAGWEPTGFGYLVEITHKDGWQTLYAHTSEIYAWEGKMVNRGDCIASVGETGRATGPHLHWEIRNQRGCPVNPSTYGDPELT